MNYPESANTNKNIINPTVDSVEEKIRNLVLIIAMIKDASNRYYNELRSFISKRNDDIYVIQKQRCGPITPRLEKEYLKYIDGCQNGFLRISQIRYNIFTSIERVLNFLIQVQDIVINERLANWKHEQAKMSNNTSNLFNVHNPNELERIQNYFNVLFESIIYIRTALETIHSLHIQANIVDNRDYKFTEIVTNALRNLVTSSLILERQPSQAIKKDARCNASVRMLITKFSEIPEKLLVSVSILSESQALLQRQQPSSLTESSGCILYNTEELQLRPENGHLSCQFRRMTVKKVKMRYEHDPKKNVCDEKFVLLFRLKFQVENMAIDIWTMSLPIVVFTFGYQDSRAWATVLWGNAFPEVDLFSVTEKVPWSELASVLNKKFETQTGRSLTEEHLDYLYKKFNFSAENELISFAQFCKDPLPNRAFTFHDWFHAAMKLTRDYLSKPWQDGLIIGFIERDKAEEMLLKSTYGTFLLRFTDSMLGALTIAWVEHNKRGKIEVSMCEPFRQKDFEQSLFNLYDYIKELTAWTKLYPNIPKEKVFANEPCHFDTKSIFPPIKCVLKGNSAV